MELGIYPPGARKITLQNPYWIQNVFQDLFQNMLQNRFQN